MRVDLPHRLLLVLACACGPAAAPRPAHAEEAPSEVKAPEGTYAGKDARWWFAELHDPSMRDGAQQALGLLGPSADEVLLEGLGDADVAVRRACIELLRRAQAPAPRLAEVLALRLVAERDRAILKELLRLLPRVTGTLALVEGLLPLTQAPEPGMRAAACEVLGTLRLPADQVPPSLPRLIEEGDLGQASAAMRVLAASPGTHEILVRAGLAILARPEEPDARLVQEARQLVLRARIAKDEITAALDAAARRWPGAGGMEALEALAEIAPRDPRTGTLLFEALRSTNDPRRQAAWRLIERAPACVQACPGALLVELLESPLPHVRTSVLRVLARVGSSEPGVLTALARARDAAPADPEVQGALTTQLASAPLAEALGVVRALPRGLRSQALQSLQWRARSADGPTLASEAARLLPLLEAWLEGPDALPAREVAVFLAQHIRGAQDAAALDVLARFLSHPSPELANAAAQCLNASREGIAHRLDMLSSPRVEVRRRASLGALAGRGVPATEEEHARLLAALGDPDAEVRAGVARWLGTWWPWSYLPWTWPAPPEERRRLARAALDLAQLGTAADRALAVQLYVQAQVPVAEMLPVLRRLLEGGEAVPQPEALARAFALTAEWVDAPVVAALVEDLEAPEMLRRAHAALVLASLRQQPELVKQGLPGLLAHPSPRVVSVGVWIAKLLGPVAQDTADRLRAMADADQPQGIAMEAVRALVAVAPDAPETAAALRRWLVDGPRAARWGLPTALAEMGRRGLPLLVEGLGRGSPVAELCMMALQHMGGDARDALPALRERALKRPDDKALAALIASLEGG